MTLEPGQELLHYRIVEKIGEGGMGVVWKAVDTTLDRPVAIKVLPEAFAAHPDRLARFEREAKLLASLQHPNIAAVYGLHRTEGAHLLAMEWIEGEDLAVRLARGPLPVDDAVAIARQIAEALETAHGNGIVHRDLKPANVLLTPDGKAKVLDFGLAKTLVDDPAGGEDPALSPTATSLGTVAGVILGTAAYMSPEQARGKPVDRRADLWALGVVMYEMLVGRAPFGGETVSDHLASVIKSDPDWSQLPAGLPPGVTRLLRRCLAKDPIRRLHDAADARIELELAFEEADEPQAEDDAGARVATSLTWMWVLPVMLVLGILVGIWIRSGGPVEQSGKVVAMQQLTDQPGLQHSPSLSSDGQQLLYVAENGGDEDIFLQRVGGEKPINLTEDFADDDYQPAFSPDRSQIVFGSRREGGGLFVMGATGESPRRISNAGFDPAWSPDGSQLVYTTERITDPYRRASVATLWVVDVAGGERRQLNEIDAAGPDWSPGGQRIAFWTHRATVQGQRDIWTIDVDGTKPLPVTEDVHTDWDPMWSPDGRWLYFFSDRGGSPDLWRVAIDQKTGRLGGEPQPVTTGIARVVGGDIAANGQSIVLTAIRARGEILRAGFDPEALRLTGSPSSILSSSNPFNQVDISPDGRRLAYRTTAPRETLYIADLEGGGRRKILDDEHRNRGPRFSPDGEWLVFYSNRNGSYEEWAIQTNGTELTQITDEPDLDLDQASWSSDGRRLFVPIMSDKETCLAYADLGDGGVEGLAGQTRELERLPGSDDFAMDTLSPDDRHVVGQMLGPRGEWLTAVYSLETSTARVLEQENGQPYRHEALTWLDERRVVFWDHELDSAVVLDIESNEARFIPDLPGPSEILLTPDRRTVVINLLRYESDIWMLTLGQ